jgi:hypothetical protein
LETMALCPHQGARTPETGNLSECGHLRGHQPEGAMAPGSDPGYSDWYEQPMAKEPRVSVCQRAVGEYPLPDYGPVGSVNRLVRTRTLGGVGRGS